MRIDLTVAYGRKKRGLGQISTEYTLPIRIFTVSQYLNMIQQFTHVTK